jgi:hypothetical protein
MDRRLLCTAAVLAALPLAGCGELLKAFIPVEPQPNEPGFVDAGIGYDGAVPDRLTVNAAKPDHGPFTGGSEVIITGSGFVKGAAVKIGGKIPQVGDLQVLSPLAIRVARTPPGEVGPADVVVSIGNEYVTLAGGFTYDPIVLDPDSGPTSGGTLVTLEGKGTDFKSGMTLALGGKPLVDVEVISQTTLRAKTPPGAAGPADLTLSGLGGGGEKTIAGAFTYYASTNPKSGGLGGGPIAGTLTVSVLNWLTRKPVVGAKVVVQKERAFTLTALADGKGIAVFADKGLSGPVSVSAGFPDYESTTMVSFDARDVTIFLMPIPKPQPGPLPPAPLTGTVEGFVLFAGPTGAGSPYWKLVPEPKTDQVKRTYVYMTSPSVEWGPQTPLPSATIDYEGPQATAWPYSVSGRTGAFAVYAVAGLYNKATNVFDPYAMGVTRGIVVGPGETKQHDVWVEIPLTEKITIKLQGVPPAVNQHRLRLGISLGAEGIIMRQDHEVVASGVLASRVFTRLPSFAHQGLADASYAFDIQIDSAAADGLPTVRATERSLRPDADGAIVVDAFVHPPEQLKPAPGAALEGNTLAWAAPGGAPNLAVTLVRMTDETPVWRVLSPGDVTQVKLPDPKTLGLPAWPAGPLRWGQWLARLPGFSFSSYTYSHLNSSYWTRWSFDEFELKAP